MNLMEGVVVDVSDPQQMGRVKIWIPAVDGEMYKLEQLPWATFVSPLAGQTRDMAAGAEGASTGLVSYGWWAVPKKGALVIVGFLYGDPNRRVYMGSYFRDHGNRSIPAGRHRSEISAAPVTDVLEVVQPANTNLMAQFSGNLTASEARTRGAYERAAAQDKTIKDGTEGYQRSPDAASKDLDPQTYALTTPGRHALIFQDNPSTGRIRVKTASGHQIILDDANERIYVSTARGNSYIELDQDGRVHVYAAASLSCSTGGDFNLSASGAVNIQAGAAVNIQAGAALNMAGCSATNISGAGVNLESSAGFNILAAGNLLQTAPNIHLNGPGAGGAACPTLPTTVPQHEPWQRAKSKQTRNKNWQS